MDVWTVDLFYCFTQVRSLTPSDILDFFDARLAEGAEGRRKLASFATCRKHADGGARSEPGAGEGGGSPSGG